MKKRELCLFDQDCRTLLNHLSGDEVYDLMTFIQESDRLHRINTSKTENSQLQILAVGMKKEETGVVLYFTSFSDEESQYVTLLRRNKYFLVESNGQSYDAELLRLYRRGLTVIEKHRL